MQRALELAVNGQSQVSPNPMVGCVIVHQEKIIGEGWHEQYGGPHAEVNAINSVVDKELLKSSTVYVSLEPCSHIGKTPPCADLLSRHQVKRVVIGTVDTNPLVSGKGIEKLNEAGIEVKSGILEQESRHLNRRFFSMIEKRRPYIVLKWAQTQDGFIARANFDSKWISNELSRKLVHQWRSEEDAILVGSQTVKVDNPKLTVREWNGRNPLRLIIDRKLSLNGQHVILDEEPTIIYNTLREETLHKKCFMRLPEANFFQEMVKDIFNRRIQSVLVEGGTKTLQQFIDSGLWDEARIFTSTKQFETGIAAPRIKGKKTGEAVIQSDRLTILENGE